MKYTCEELVEACEILTQEAGITDSSQILGALEYHQGEVRAAARNLVRRLPPRGSYKNT